MAECSGAARCVGVGPLVVALLAAAGGARGQSVEWVQRNVAGPGGRVGHAMAYDSRRGVTVLHGGRSSTTGQVNHETWEWDGAVWVRRSESGPPRLFGNHEMIYDAARGVTVLFGGYSTTLDFLGETWEWDGANWMQRMVAGPPPRMYHGMVFDSSRGIAVLFGGFGRTQVASELNDTWEWDGTAWMERPAIGPSKRKGFDMTFDPIRGTTVLFGGHVEAGLDDDQTWEWNGSGGAWTRRMVSGPAARNSHEMVFDATRGVTVLFGGWSGGESNETWEWNGAAWMRRLIGGPSPRFGHDMVYDSIRGVTVLFGGDPNGETWELTTTCYANCDGSTIAPALNTLDFGCFLNKFAAGDTYANCDGSTIAPVLNVIDFACFLNAFATGCS